MSLRGTPWGAQGGYWGKVGHLGGFWSDGDLMGGTGGAFVVRWDPFWGKVGVFWCDGDHMGSLGGLLSHLGSP